VLRKSLLYAFMLALITPPPPDLTLYRGTGNMALGPAFFARDEQGCAGGVELAIMSATPDREVAMGYAGAEAGKEPTKDLPTLYIIPVEQASTPVDRRAAHSARDWQGAQATLGCGHQGCCLFLKIRTAKVCVFFFYRPTARPRRT
jgi:hypothetical protein